MQLKEAGVGSLPGTSAEILDDDLRQQVAVAVDMGLGLRSV